MVLAFLTAAWAQWNLARKVQAAHVWIVLAFTDWSG
jgi:hypothetical protein